MAMKKYYAESELIINPDGSIFSPSCKAGTTSG